ncbi:MAG: S8 family serine peptidase [Thermoleophilia bacterium]|nr:S8 family serine peptidase [Thermoleophilia bacterium]
MQKHRHQTTESHPSPQGASGISRQFPLLLLLLATISIALLCLATVAIASSPRPPMELPPVTDAATASVSGASTSASGATTWIVGGRPGAVTDRIAGRAGASPVDRTTGIFTIDRDDAVAFAGSLDGSGRLVFAEPDVAIAPASYPADLYSDNQWWLNRIVNPTVTTPPAVNEFSPELAVIEESVDPLHPDLTTARLADASSLSPAKDSHGTAVAAIAGSPGEGLGIRGVWPGMKMRLVPSGTTCSTAANAVIKAVKAGSAVLNLSYALPVDSCFSHFVATEYAVSKGVLPVASAGNTGLEGNAAVRPANDPHVLTVSAVDEDGLTAPFATSNPGVDITAPGVAVFAPDVTTNPTGGVKRSWSKQSGTSFSAPMVSAAAAWLLEARPDLDAEQVSKALTHSATDLGAPGRDDQYGEGLLNIDAALTVTAPSADRREPNNDIKWIDGSLLKKAGFLFKPGSGRSKAVTATLAQDEDPADVYRVKIAPRRKVLITGAQYQGDIKLEVFKPKVKSILKPGKNLIVKSDRPRTKTEGVRVQNLKRKAQIVYVAVTPSPHKVTENYRYRLSVFAGK